MGVLHGYRAKPSQALNSTISIFRFLRHVPVIYVDYPGPTSLTQIYGTFNRAMLRIVPPLRSYAQPLTDAMVEFYSMSQVGERCAVGKLKGLMGVS